MRREISFELGQASARKAARPLKNFGERGLWVCQRLDISRSGKSHVVRPRGSSGDCSDLLLIKQEPCLSHPNRYDRYHRPIYVGVRDGLLNLTDSSCGGFSLCITVNEHNVKISVETEDALQSIGDG